MKDNLKNYIGIATFFLVLWGIGGLIGGDGFFGGISEQIDAIGSIISKIINFALVIGVIWVILELSKNKGNSKKD